MQHSSRWCFPNRASGRQRGIFGFRLSTLDVLVIHICYTEACDSNAFVLRSNSLPKWVFNLLVCSLHWDQAWPSDRALKNWERQRDTLMCTGIVEGSRQRWTLCANPYDQLNDLNNFELIVEARIDSPMSKAKCVNETNIQCSSHLIDLMMNYKERTWTNTHNQLYKIQAHFLFRTTPLLSVVTVYIHTTTHASCDRKSQ